MKILAINNYSLSGCLEIARKRETPYTHSWGIDYFIAQGDKVDTILYRNGGGKKGLLHNIWFSIKNIPSFNKHDVVISFCNPVLGWASYLKRLGVIKSRLYTLVHHQQNHMFLSDGFDKILFLSKDVMEATKKQYPHLAGKMEYIEWGQI